MEAGAPRVRPAALALACLAALLLSGAVCLAHRINAALPAGRRQGVSILEPAASDLPVLIDGIRQEKGFLQITGALPGMRAKPYLLRAGLLSEGEGGELVLLHTQMVRRPDLKREYGCDDHCGFAASVGSGRLAEGAWRVVLLLGPEREETILDTGRTIAIGGGGA